MTRRRGAPRSDEDRDVDPEAALRALYARWAAPLRGYARRALGDDPAAEELAQDVLLRAWRHGHAHEDPAELGPWLFTVARNLVIDQRRRANARPPRADGAVGVDEPAMGIDEIDTLVARAEVLEALRQLPARQREVVAEVFYRGHTVAAAADVLGIPAGTVKSRLFYGLRALRDNLEEMGALP